MGLSLGEWGKELLKPCKVTPKGPSPSKDLFPGTELHKADKYFVTCSSWIHVSCTYVV